MGERFSFALSSRPPPIFAESRWKEVNIAPSITPTGQTERKDCVHACLLVLSLPTQSRTQTLGMAANNWAGLPTSLHVRQSPIVMPRGPPDLGNSQAFLECVRLAIKMNCLGVSVGDVCLCVCTGVHT